jgi:hypothetical protein
MTYTYPWANNSKRKTLKDREFKVVTRFKKMNSCAVVFIDNGQFEIISRNSLRKKVKT